MENENYLISLRTDPKSWVISFLNSEGQNPDLAKGIEYHTRYTVMQEDFPLERLHRIAGPEPGTPYRADEIYWEQTIVRLIDRLKNGLMLPPLIAVDFVDEKGLAIADGNKRFEALKRLGFKSYMTVLCFKNDPRIYHFT